MNTFFVKNSQIHSGVAKVTGDDFHHLKNVLRLKPGEGAYICNEDGSKFVAKLFEIREDMAVFDLIKKEPRNAELTVDITLYQGLPKSDKMEKVIKETTQLGIKEIVPTKMRNCVVKLDTTGIEKKTDRWQKIAEEAAKQSGRQIIPTVSRVINFENIIENIEKYDIVLLLYELEDKFTLKDAILKAKESLGSIKNIALIIGPEGGFSEEEVSMLSSSKNLYICTLGSRVLRTELAPIMAVSNLVYEFDL